jgi:hypothetical protein
MIEFLHNDSPCMAFIPDRNSIQDTLTVYILDHNMELGYELIFLQDSEKKWESVSTIKSNYPSTFSNICNKLQEQLRGYSF